MNTAPIDGLTKLPSLFRESAVFKAQDAPADGTATEPAVVATILGMPTTPPNGQASSVQQGGAQDRATLVSLEKTSAGRAASASQDAQSAQKKARQNEAASPDNMKKLQEVLDEFQKKSTALRFTIDKDNGRVVVKVVDQASGKVVRQIPPDEVLAMQDQMEKIRGLLFDHVT